MLNRVEVDLLDACGKRARLGQPADDQVELTGEKPRLDDGIDADVEAHVEPRQAFVQARNRARHDRVAPIRTRADVDASRLAAGECVELAVCDATLRLDEAGMGKQRNAARRERHSACAPVEEGHTHLLLELAHAFRQRGLAHGELACGGAEIARAGDREERPQETGAAQ